MIDIDKVFGKTKKKSNVMDMDRILPKFPKTNITNPEKKETIVVHNHFHVNTDGFAVPKGMEMNNQQQNKFATLNGEKELIPQQKKKMIWEKSMQSIYRSDKDV